RKLLTPGRRKSTARSLPSPQMIHCCMRRPRRWKRSMRRLRCPSLMKRIGSWRCGCWIRARRLMSVVWCALQAAGKGTVGWQTRSICIMFLVMAVSRCLRGGR
ncbi:hypothetical protein E4U57_006576, partial [Claviceps arundinis]